MRRIVIAIAATLAILAAGSITPNHVEAMRVTTPSGIQNALNEQPAPGCPGRLSPRLALRAVWLWLAAGMLARGAILRRLRLLWRLWVPSVLRRLSSLVVVTRR